jgi:hypothetical protein
MDLGGMLWAVIPLYPTSGELYRPDFMVSIKKLGGLKGLAGGAHDTIRQIVPNRDYFYEKPNM